MAELIERRAAAWACRQRGLELGANHRAILLEALAYLPPTKKVAEATSFLP